VAFSERADGPYGPASAPITGDYWAEGPSAIRIGDTWFVYFDKYQLGRYGVVTSTDMVRWKDRSDELNLPAGVRHGTAFRVEKRILDGVSVRGGGQ